MVRVFCQGSASRAAAQPTHLDALRHELGILGRVAVALGEHPLLELQLKRSDG